MGREEVALSTRQPSLITTEQGASHRRPVIAGESFPRHHHMGLCGCSLSFSLYLIK